MAAPALNVANFWDQLGAAADPSVRLAGEAPEGWYQWLKELFPRFVSKSFADHHITFWEWCWAIERGLRPPPFVGIWARGGGKSTALELGVTGLGARGKRSYVVYVSETQDQADKRVQNIAAMLESESILAYYPELGQRSLSKFGAVKGWRRDRIWTASGFVVDALGLDTAARGLKVEEQRPDLIVLDDVDGRHDSEKTTKKKIQTITETIIPMGSGDVAVAAVQNLITNTGIFAQIASGKATFLVDRLVSGPIPAIENLEVKDEPQENGVIRHKIVGGEATWEGQDIEACQGLIDNVGLTAFLREQQHKVDLVEGALWQPEYIRRVGARPETFRRIVVGVDPSGGAAEIGIVAAGLGFDGILYVLEDWTQPGRLGPSNWGNKVADLYDYLEADKVVAEKNFGGDMVESTIRVKEDVVVYVELVNASRGKQIRAEPIVSAYQDNRVVHVGTFQKLETEMTTWVPGEGESPNRLDALVWALTDLLLPEGKGSSGKSARPPGM